MGCLRRRSWLPWWVCWPVGPRDLIHIPRGRACRIGREVPGQGVSRGPGELLGCLAARSETGRIGRVSTVHRLRDGVEPRGVTDYSLGGFVHRRLCAWVLGRRGGARMIPEEDRGPAWLRDYGYTDFGDIAADIAAMEEFARKLAAEVQDNYAPHLTAVSDAMLTQLPPPAATFPELVDFMTAHHEAQETTQLNVYNFADGTNHFARVAESIGSEYRGTDAFSQARVKDVDKAFDKTYASDSVADFAGGDL